MKAMILAAGRGERMRPLTDTLPKPLLHVKGKALIEWHIEKLAHKGFDEIIINIGHLGSKIPAYLGNGLKWGVRILYSDEQKSGALESAGGIKKALSLLGDAPFLVVNGDIFCEYDYNPNFKLTDTLAHLVLVPNPAHNPKGDFGLQNGLVTNEDKIMYTFSGIGYYHPKLFEEVRLQKSPLAPLLRKNIDKSLVSGELFNKMWHDIGTPQRLQEINEN
ncbi:nucleotidyltransferase family protein [Sulfurimonas sp. SWIR-19]|uniref:N-acetylmuramate alpha-1-phosphate uridylyltransferase MurU n=1 Tax=Sulfurimonas sp. SWIR-19 TaxID=2878390 RepID=UPI001CF1FFC9|nr:nucleotidyltransferase family protein [Sulfurimonas sp. SWIR-19]UCN00184.1 nucleotidyltransferase family protein [Sulfurimonas sp. SWIR-19]